MNRLLNFLRGCVTVEIRGGNQERFLNLCGSSQIFLWKILRKEDRLLLMVAPGQFKRLKPIVRKTRVHCKIVQKKGLPFFFEKYRKRKAFFAGIFLCLGLIWFFNLFIWDLEVQGNSRLTDETLLDFLAEENVAYGSYKPRVDSRELERKVRNRYDEIIWASVEKRGTRLILYVQESLLPEKEKQKESGEPASLYSTREGKIVQMITREGTPVTGVGSYVSEGSLLVDGRISVTGDDGSVTSTRLCRADADVYVLGEVAYEDVIALAHEERRATGRQRNQYYVTLFSKTFDLSHDGAKYERKETLTELTQLKLWGDFYLPIFVGKIIEKEYENYVTIYENEEAIALANERLQQFCDELERKGIQIVEKDVKITVNEKNCTASGTIEVIEKTGENREIQQEEQSGQ